jgi:hypothetical protein
MRIARPALATGLAAAATGTLILTTTTPATAKENVHVNTAGCDGYTASAGWTQFQPHGEHLYVHDSDWDGARVVAKLYIDGDYKDTYEAVGFGETTHKNLSIAEGRTVKLVVYLKNNGHKIDCTQDSGSGTA